MLETEIGTGNVYNGKASWPSVTVSEWFYPWSHASFPCKMQKRKIKKKLCKTFVHRDYKPPGGSFFS